MVRTRRRDAAGARAEIDGLLRELEEVDAAQESAEAQLQRLAASHRPMRQALERIRALEL